MPGTVKIKICKHCARAFPMVGRQTVCRECSQKRHKEACFAWWKRQPQGIRKKYETRGGENKRDYNHNAARPELTFEFTAGKWYWRAANGLTNGPFDTIRAARQDAYTAL